MTELALFGCAFVAVFALGFQSLNVNGGHYLAAFLTSFAIGGSNLVLMRLIPGASWSEIAATLLGGPFGIVCAMRVHRATLGRRRDLDGIRSDMAREFEALRKLRLLDEFERGNARIDAREIRFAAQVRAAAPADPDPAPPHNHPAWLKCLRRRRG